jgi:hypothetical protein
MRIELQKVGFWWLAACCCGELSGYVTTGDLFNISLPLSLPPLVPQPSLGLGLLRNLLPLKMAEFLGGFLTNFFFTG